MDATLSLLVGWSGAGIAILALYGAASVVGAISQPYGWRAGTVNEWPYPGNGAWGVLANVSVLMLGLVLTTVATSWWLRKSHAYVSDGRLTVVLLFAGWVPMGAAGPKGGLFGFVIALLLVRHWVVGRYEGRLRPSTAAALVAGLGAIVLSYGLLHPLWTAAVFPTSAGKQHSVTVDIHNAARVAVTIDRIDASDIGRSGAHPARLHLPPGGHGLITVSVYEGCGTGVFDLHARYHVFGLTLNEALPVRVQLHSRDGSC